MTIDRTVVIHVDEEHVRRNFRDDVESGQFEYPAGEDAWVAEYVAGVESDAESMQISGSAVTVELCGNDLGELATCAMSALVEQRELLNRRRERVVKGPAVGVRRERALHLVDELLAETERALELARKHHPTRRAILASIDAQTREGGAS